MSRIKNLVTAEWLINNIALDNLKICDATYFLPTHNRDAEEEYVKEHVEDAVNSGAKIVIGGDMHTLGGNFYQPTILSDVTSKAKITYEWVFLIIPLKIKC